MIDSSRCLLGSLLLSGFLTAQVPVRPELGPFSTTGLGFMPAGPGNDLVEYRADHQLTQAFPPIGNGIPEFTRDRIFHQLTPQQRLAVEIDAISTGCDVIPVVKHQASGQFRITQLGILGWSALFFSVDGSSAGAGSPGPVADRAAAGGAGADLYSWITPGSNVLGGLESRVFLDVPSDRLGVPQDEEITAIDIPMALMAQSQSSHVSIFAEHENDFFFSLTQVTARALDVTGSPLAYIPSVDWSGGTVFKVHWDGANWSDITVAFHPYELGLAGASSSSANDDTDLDALAVNANLVDSPVVFSVRNAAPANLAQVNFYLRGSSTNAGLGELFDQNGNSIQNQLGGSDIDAVCGVDPETISHLSPWLGTPLSDVANPPLILSVTQMLSTATSALTMVVDVNGPKSTGSKLDVQPAPGSLWVLLNNVEAAGPWLPWGVLAPWATAVPWNGTGSVRLTGPVTIVLGGAVQFRAVFLPAGGGIEMSTTVRTTL